MSDDISKNTGRKKVKRQPARFAVDKVSPPKGGPPKGSKTGRSPWSKKKRTKLQGEVIPTMVDSEFDD